MSIDKRALREAAEKYRTTHAAHLKNPRNYDALDAWDKAISEFMALVNNDELNIITSLIEEVDMETGYREGAFVACNRWHTKFRDTETKLEAAENRIAELESKTSTCEPFAHEQNELAINTNLDSINDAVEMDRLYKRIAELERSETQLINERDYAESALNDAYKAVMGQAPEWSNWFSFENAIDEIELACEQWRNQTDDVIQFRQRIQELEEKLANPVLLPKTNGYWTEQEKAYEEAITLAKRQVRLAGFSVEDM